MSEPLCHCRRDRVGHYHDPSTCPARKQADGKRPPRGALPYQPFPSRRQALRFLNAVKGRS